MRFYVVQWRGRPPQNAEYPCLVLISNDWDDYSYRTTFDVEYYDQNRRLQIQLKGGLKILDSTSQKTQIPTEFTQLSNRYCSLGQSLQYYTELQALGDDVCRSLLKSLRDVVFNQSIARKFSDLPGFRTSLLRFSEAEKAYKEARKLLFRSQRKQIDPNRYTFTFRCKLPRADNEHVVDFDFSTDPTGLSRITALIGKNGTGKTQFLANFARAMSGLDSRAGIFEMRNQVERPSFSKVMAISYSVFDEFRRPYDEVEDQGLPNSEQAQRLKEQPGLFSYVYCGIRLRDRLLTQEEIREKLDKALMMIRDAGRIVQWQELIGTLIDTANLGHLGAAISTSRVDNFYNELSSGQRVLVLVMSEVIANIENDSIILFDEPELHLHPEAISSMVRTLHLLLDEFKSYAIIATHSPIILQEIPSKMVCIFRRQNSYVTVDMLEIESFGENLTTLIDEVFETSGLHNNYKSHLRRLLQEYSDAQILQLFDNRLGLNARAALAALTKSSRSGE